MVSYKEIGNQEFKKKLMELFPIEELFFAELIFGGTIPIIFVKFNSIDNLSANWKDFNSHIVTEFMISIKEEYSRWNFYIFYLSAKLIEKPLKYEIENNKFGSRKIVIENCNTFSEKELNKIISEHITNDNIQITFDTKKVAKFQKEPSLSKIIDKLNLNIKSKDDELQNALDQIEKIYKDEI